MPDPASPRDRQVHVPIWLWAALAAFIGPALFQAGSPTPAGVAFASITIAISIGHAAVALGWRAAMVFLAICLVVTFSVENLGVLTGMPFGRYHFVVGGALVWQGSSDEGIDDLLVLWTGAAHFG